MVGHFETERETLEKFIGQPIKQHNNLKENKVLLESILGVGKVVARQVLMVLLGSHQFNSASQCAAYLGFPCRENQAAVSKAVRSSPKTATPPSAPNFAWQRSPQPATTQTLKPNMNV
jgi:Transposase IS116/IS110/IS902 family